MAKIDYKKTLRHLYAPNSKQVEFIDVPPMNYLMVHGQGEPGGEDFTAAVEALYPVAYTIKFAIKKALGLDYVVPPLEGLWWAEDMNVFINGERKQWQWTMMIMQPDSVTKAVFEEARQHVKAKKQPAAIEKVTFETLKEGKCAQILHLGPFADEGPTIVRVHNAITEAGGRLSGKHHEIYLSDMRRVAPEKYRTIIRQPMQ